MDLKLILVTIFTTFPQNLVYHSNDLKHLNIIYMIPLIHVHIMILFNLVKIFIFIHHLSYINLLFKLFLIKYFYVYFH